MASTDWLERLLAGTPDYERELVDRYSHGLLELARRQLPERIRRRVDPEDVVQSVYRSFFRRLNAGEFGFEESHDVWRLLAVMTFRKARNQVKHHSRQQRSSFRETAYESTATGGQTSEPIDPAPQPADLAIMIDFLDQLLAELPTRHHDVVTLRLEGHSTAEVAKQLGISKRTVLRVLSHLQTLAGKLIGVKQ